MATTKRRSKTPWGWIAFGVGLAVCVGAGGVVGVMLGQSDGESDTDARRVAALALDARGLNDDALSLSRAIEEAIAREELEGEAESLRTDLARLEARAERIRVRAESGAGAGPPQVREVSRSVERGLGEISRTVAVFERDVVGRLEPVLDAPPPVPSEEASDPSVDEALADVTQVLEEQGEALTALAEDLEASDGATDASVAENADLEEGEPVAGSFDVALAPPGRTLEVGYELRDLESEANLSDAEPGEATITSSAAGELTLSNTGSRRESVELPIFHLVLYWKEADVPPAARDGVLRAGPSTEGIEGEAIEGAEGEAKSAGSDPCRYEIEGDPHCALARFVFGEEVDHHGNAAGELVLHPDDEIGIDALEPDGSLIVRKRKADSVADFLSSRAPDLVQVLATEPGESFRPACLAPPDLEEEAIEATSEPYGESLSEGAAAPYAESETAATTLGLLASDGEIIFEAEETGQPIRLDSDGEPEAPECYSLRDE